MAGRTELVASHDEYFDHLEVALVGVRPGEGGVQPKGDQWTGKPTWHSLCWGVGWLLK